MIEQRRADALSFRTLGDRQHREVRVRALVEIVNQGHQICVPGWLAVDLRDDQGFVILGRIEPLPERPAIAFDELGFITPGGDVERHQPFGDRNDKGAVSWLCGANADAGVHAETSDFFAYFVSTYSSSSRWNAIASSS